ncbi:E3 ubiquitin-protein ligase Praja-2-like isoform X2 [Acipenser ruthenus]|uniref:E3 ubiquitin-protein ligase Praja-2 isoform X1 n=2 Tax=Acipenser ruthenus TaxID=7906 RepID=UPI002742231E|nr:E3 ubiquitin-protein ligase Praja-2 isoform X1 [Acipenser ruthenus]XP_058847642.1 E3 ubiquitin-protein ligase Praja-2-like isoform X2 [Acipenser ruthenus]
MTFWNEEIKDHWMKINHLLNLETNSQRKYLDEEMGQEAGKPAWPKPAGGYQTITGRRYGRRHAYISFRPTLAKQENSSKENSGECGGMEMNSVHKENALSSTGAISSTLHTIFPAANNSVLPEINGATIFKEGSGRKNAASKKGIDTAGCSFKMLEDEQISSNNSENGSGPKKSSEACAWPTLEDNETCPRSPAGPGFVNIDSYEPESNGGEEDDLSVDSSIGTRPGLQKRLDNMICELEKEFDYLSGLHSYLYTKSCEEVEPVPRNGCCGTDLEESSENNRMFQRRLSRLTEESLDKSKCDEKLNELDIAEAASTPVSDRSIQISDGNNDQGSSSSEMVVRPKVRKQHGEGNLERRKRSQSDDSKHGTSRPKKPLDGQWSANTPFLMTHTEKVSKESRCESARTESASKGAKQAEGKKKAIELQSCKHDEEDDLWEDFEELQKSCASFGKDDDSSECSEGEWSPTWTSDSAVDKEQSSSDESWETLPGLDEPEHEIQSSSSSSLDDVPELNFHSEEQASLEDGEIPWLPYQEETDSSSDDDTDGMSQFVHPGLFMLDGNNNFEDDSSVSEDFDAEWRLLDEFGEGFGVAQAFSYVDPQMLTYMALEERLAQAMEAALAHLESLAIDVEQAHPPATEEIIDCLPQITVLEDHHGQEQCCAICCCEYMKDEIATELPCRHVFHKSCVTRWLQKSATCPVCRHVLSPALPDSTVATTFVLDHDTPPSTHSAAGTR